MERMSSAATTPSSTKAFADLSREELLVSVADLAIKLKTTEHQLDWLKRQVFGEKSEKRFMHNPNQLGFGMEGFEDVAEEDKRTELTVTYTRKNGPKCRPEVCALMPRCQLRLSG